MAWCWRLLLLVLMLPGPLEAAWVWVEGENAAEADVSRHPWYAQVKKRELSGGDLLAHFDPKKGGSATYKFEVPEAGAYTFWLRANPVLSRMTYALNGGGDVPLDLKANPVGQVNLAADSKPDLRFAAWFKVGEVTLKQGRNEIAFQINGGRENHGLIDCFLFTTEPFSPRGTAKPDEVAKLLEKVTADNQGWQPWAPGPMPENSALSLRHLNENQAGDGGFIQAKDGRFVHGKTGKPVRFWAVNGPPKDLKGERLEKLAGQLARYGVNLVRVHGAVFDRQTGQFNEGIINRYREVMAAMKAEGIYTHLSIYFPLWFEPRANLPWLEGYNGKEHPFAAIYFNDGFQQRYRDWWKRILTTPGPDGKRLIDDPALMGVELVNEDSLFFWTFDYKRVPAPQMRIFEKQFGDWAKAKYGSLEKALAAWDGQGDAHDDLAAGRLGFRPLWNIVNQRSKRDQATVAFLLEVQRGFYQEQVEFIRGLGFKGLITASNWHTASPEILGPLERYSYTVGDFIDRHGYFGSHREGEGASWSLRDGHVVADRSALRFEPVKPQGGPKGAPVFSHPVMDSHLNGLPSMISETAWTRPNRYRGEAPLYYATYGALQGSDAIVHFALDGDAWSAKPNFYMQPWTLMAPTQMGQFPAAALIYRQGLVKEGEVVVDVKLKLADLLELKGTPLAASANLDKLRQADAQDGGKSSAWISPMMHLVGRTSVTIGDESEVDLKPPGRFLDLERRRITSETGEVVLDYGKGVLTVDAPRAQIASGNLRRAGAVRLGQMEVTSPLETVHLALVPLDGQPVATSAKLLLQVMTEEKATGYETMPHTHLLQRVVSTGGDPWLFREPAGTVKLLRADAARLKVSPLGLDGMPGRHSGPVMTADAISLRPEAAYYLIEK